MTFRSAQGLGLFEQVKCEVSLLYANDFGLHAFITLLCWSLSALVSVTALLEVKRDSLWKTNIPQPL